MTIQRVKTESFFSDAKNLKILVVGDLMLDEYLWGKADRISPEAPVQIVDVVRQELRLGGAGNVVNNLTALGCRVTVCGVIGDDENAGLLLDALKAKNADTSGIFLQPGRTTSRKTRIIAANQQIVRIDRESRDPIDGASAEKIGEFIRRNISSHHALLVSDYLKGVLTPPVLETIIECGRASGIPVVIDPKGNDYGKYTGATLLTPNRKEAETASRIPIHDEASLVQAGNTLLSSVQLDHLLVTRSEEGMTLFSRNEPPLHIATHTREVYDVTGAGDTVVSILGLGLAGGLSVREACEVANVGAGIVVGKIGTATVSPDEILAEMSRREPRDGGKIKKLAELVPVAEQLRLSGRKIVFTNGCFDLLHFGHVSYLQKAKRLGDVLILGLNSDASIRRLKGEKRPIIAQEERAHIMAALECIDYVVVFEEDTPIELIRAIRPDILAKGADYTPETVVGRELVESWGGRVELVALEEGKSTTGTIQKILQAF